MNDELKTKEYLKTLEQITLSDSARVRMREELVSHARFHTATAPDILIKSPFNWLLLRTSQTAFAFLLLCGIGVAVYGVGGREEVSPIAMNKGAQQATSTDSASATSSESEEGTLVVVAESVSDSTVFDRAEESQDSSLSRDAMMKESADMAQDEAMMITMRSEAEINIEDYQRDIILRERTYRALVTKYQGEIGTDTIAELTAKLDTIAKLLKDTESKEEDDARPLLDSAMSITGEIESTLSLLGTVTVENGVIIAIDF